MARGTTAPPLRTGHRRWLLTVPALAGLGYTLSWIAGLAVPAPSPAFGATGAEIVAALSGHGPVVAAQYALTEGLPAGASPSSRSPWPGRPGGTARLWPRGSRWSPG